MAFNILFPIKHPNKIAVDEEYPILVEKLLGTHKVTYIFRKIEMKLRIMLYEKIKTFFRKQLTFSVSHESRSD